MCKQKIVYLMNGAAAMGDEVFFLWGEGGIDFVEAVGNKAGGEGDAVGDDRLWLGEKFAGALSVKDVRDVIVW